VTHAPPPLFARDIPGLTFTAAAQPADPAQAPDPTAEEDPIQYTTEPVTLPRRSLEAARAYLDGHASGVAEGRLLEMDSVIVWLRKQGGRGAWTLVDAIKRGEHRRETK